MTRQTALNRLIQLEGDNYTLSDIIIIQRALKWYDDEIDDLHWYTHIFNIVAMYVEEMTKDKFNSYLTNNYIII